MIGVRLNAGFDFFYFLVRERKMRFGANGGFDITTEIKEILRNKFNTNKDASNICKNERIFWIFLNLFKFT